MVCELWVLHHSRWRTTHAAAACQDVPGPDPWRKSKRGVIQELCGPQRREFVWPRDVGVSTSARLQC